MLIVGKCADCKLEVHDWNKEYQRLLPKLSEYKIKSVPTIVIDGKIKIEDPPEKSSM